ncbi:metal-dependent hydrolase [Nocardiopsis coralliicola]
MVLGPFPHARESLAPGASAWLLGLTVAVGSLTHIVGDWLTKSGVPLAWPLQVRGARWHMLRSPLPFVTGDSWAEASIRAVSLAVSTIVGLAALPAAPGA